jgi:type IV pilus assembly protein PilM
MFGTDRILSLDIGASKLVMAEFRVLRPEGLELTRFATVSLGVEPESEADPSAYIVAAIRELMRNPGFRPGPVAVSISGQVVFPRYVKLPPVTPDKIAQIVRYEAQQNVPFPINEVVWDYQLVGQDSGELSVMLVAVKTDVVKNITDCVQAAGLEPELVDVSPMALYNAVRYNYADLPGCTMILDMGARSTNVVFAEGSRIFSRTIPVAGIAITKELMKEFELGFGDAEQLKLAHAFVGLGGAYEGHEVGVADRTSKIVRSVMTRLHAEVSRTINFYRSQQGGSQPSLVLLAGGTSAIANVSTFLKDKLKTEVDYLNPFRNVTVSSSISADQIGQSVHLLGEVVGVALRRVLSCPVEINLLPPDLVARRVFQRRLPFLGMAAAGLVLIMLVFWVYLHRMRAMSEERAARVQSRIEQLAAPNERLQRLGREKADVSGRIQRLAGVIRARTRWMEILDALQARMIPGMWLVALEPEADAEGGEPTRISIRGVGFDDEVSHEAVSEFAARLKGVGYFSDNVQVKRIKPVPETDYATEFIIEVGLRPDAAPPRAEAPAGAKG